MDVRTQNRISRWMKRLLVVLFLAATWATHAAFADYLDISPAAPQEYYSYANPSYHGVPGAKYLGPYLLGGDWRYVPWETPNAKLPGSETWPAFMKGLKAMIATGSDNYGLNYQTIHTDPLTACINYVHYYYAYGMPWSYFTNPFYAAGAFSVPNNICTHSLLGSFGLPSVAVTCQTLPSSYPDIPYDYDIPNKRCQRVIPQPEQYTLTLNAPAGDIEPSGAKTMSVRVVNSATQAPKADAKVRVTLEVQSGSGGHGHHDATRLKGTLTGCAPAGNGLYDCTTGSDGYAGFAFKADQVSGTHTVKAECTNLACTNDSNPNPENVNVKVAGLKPIPASGLYALYEADGSVIGAVPGRHPSNHYLTPTAANKLLVIAINYHHLYPKDPVLHVNDASLMWGGVFDLDADWDIPHEEHRRGSVVDIRANLNTGAIPAANFQSFIQSAKDRGVDARIHNPGETSQHFHVRLLNRSE